MSFKNYITSNNSFDGFQTEARGSRTPKKRRSHKTNNSEQYAGNVLQFFPTSEGYVKATRLDKSQTELSFNYIYNYTDHLGNVRLSYTLDPQTGKLRIVDEHHYYPFGLRHEVHYPSGNRLDFYPSSTQVGDPVQLINVTKTEYLYRYNGKEFQDELGLNMYAMDMRQYDPAIARWVVQDPVVHFDYSPYNAFDNNPVFWADPSGADATSLINDIVKKSNLTGDTEWVRNNDGTFSGSNGKSVDCEGCTTSKSKLTHTFSPIGFNYKNIEGERGDPSGGSDIIKYNVQIVTKNKKGMVTSSILITYFFSVNQDGKHENTVPGTMYIMGVYDPVNVSFNIDNPVTPYEKELAEYIAYISEYNKKYNSSILHEIATYNYYLKKNKEGPYKKQDIINKVSSSAKLLGPQGRMVGGVGDFINMILENQNQSTNLHGVEIGIVNKRKL